MCVLRFQFYRHICVSLLLQSQDTLDAVSLLLNTVTGVILVCYGVTSVCKWICYRIYNTKLYLFINNRSNKRIEYLLIKTIEIYNMGEVIKLYFKLKKCSIIKSFE